MIPEQKAQKLVERFGYMAEACVEEIITSWNQYSGMYDQEHFDTQVDYWQKVLKILKSK